MKCHCYFCFLGKKMVTAQKGKKNLEPYGSGQYTKLLSRNGGLRLELQ